MAVEVASLEAKVGADISPLRASLNTARSLLTGFGGTMVGAVGGVANAALGTITNALNFLRQAMTVTVGMWINQIVNTALQGINQVISTSLSMVNVAKQEYAEYERLNMSLQSLVAREMMRDESAKSINEAMEKAIPLAKELVDWTQKLAIESPFSQQGVASAFKMVMAYGFSMKEAKRLTQAMIDFSSASGQGEDSMYRIALALGQIQAKGKLAGQEILQLTEAGVNVRDVLARSLGKPVEEIVQMIEDGAIDAKTAVEAIVSSMETDFGGAAKRQANIFSGLLTSLNDIYVVVRRNLFSPMFQAVQPYLVRFVAALQSPQLLEAVQKLGKGLGVITTGFLSGLEKSVPRIRDWFTAMTGGKVSVDSIAESMARFGESLPDKVMNAVNRLANIATFLFTTLPRVIGFVKDFVKSVIELGRMPNGEWSVGQFFRRIIPFLIQTGREVLDVLIDLGTQLWTKVKPVVIDALQGILDGIMEFGRNIWNWGAPIIMDTARRLFDWLLWFLRNLPAKFVEALPEIIQGLINFFGGVWAAVHPYAVQAAQAALEGLRSALETGVAMLRQWLDTKAQEFQAGGGVIGFIKKMLFGEGGEGSQSVGDTVAGIVKDIFPIITGAIGGAIGGPGGSFVGALAGKMIADTPMFNEAITGLGALIDEKLPGVRQKLDEFGSAITTGWNDAKTWIDTNLPGLQTALEGFISSVYAKAQETFGPGIENFTSGFQKIKEWFDTYGPALQANAENLFNSIFTAIGPVINGISSGFIENFNKISKWFDENAPLILTAFNKFISDMNTAINSPEGQAIIKAFQNIFATIKETVGTVLDLILGAIRVALLLYTGETEEAGKILKGVWADILIGILNIFNFVFSNLVQVVKLALGGLIDVVVSALTWLTEKLMEHPSMKAAVALGLMKADYGEDWKKAGENVKGLFGLDQPTNILEAMGITREGIRQNVMGADYVPAGGAAGPQTQNTTVNQYNIYTTDNPTAIADAIRREQRISQVLNPVQ